MKMASKFIEDLHFYSLEDLKRSRQAEDLPVLCYVNDTDTLIRIVIFHESDYHRLKALHFLIIGSTTEKNAIEYFFEENLYKMRQLMLNDPNPMIRKGICLLLVNLGKYQQKDIIIKDILQLFQQETVENVKYHALIGLFYLTPLLARKIANAYLLIENSSIMKPLLESICGIYQNESLQLSN
jgi:hypothetical protein